MAYIFGCMGENAQTYLRPWYTQDLADPFLSKEEMINHLFFYL